MTAIEIPSERAALLDAGWLAVKGVHRIIHHMRFPGDTGGGTSTEEEPPADLVAFVEKACETCGGDGRTAIHHGRECPDCHGTGSELLTVTWACARCGGRNTLDRFHCKDLDCTNGTRSTLVRLTGQPVPVREGDGTWRFPCEVVR